MAGRRQPDLDAGRKNDAPFAPRVGMQRRALRYPFVGQQQIDGVINEDGDLGGIDRFQRDVIALPEQLFREDMWLPNYRTIAPSN